MAQLKVLAKPLISLRQLACHFTLRHSLYHCTRMKGISACLFVSRCHCWCEHTPLLNWCQREREECVGVNVTRKKKDHKNANKSPPRSRTPLCSSFPSMSAKIHREMVTWCNDYHLKHNMKGWGGLVLFRHDGAKCSYMPSVYRKRGCTLL